ncbi:Plasmodium vivax Vir protein, putative [Plasmodium vivax]|uniref:Vir protein, putative n=1 Tax=Plasmodium vivax TaxID=5855 RepID=A0A1G4EDL5_PLAVI|nr:Plasmodium vivax Vir protein, putative [Plasmodium vivax]
MSSCKCKGDKYIDYNCYYCLKDNFHTCYLTEGGKAYLNSSHDTRNQEIPNFTYREDILELIVKHLGCTKVFMAGHTNIACKYINFWLNEKIKALYTYKSDSYFKNYKEFLKNFYKVVDGYNTYESCTNNIKFLVDDVDDKDNEYKRLNTLYTLYKKYDELKNINKWEYKDKKTCDLIQNITSLANDIARIYKKDDEFIKVLKNLRETIKNAEGRYHEFCKTDLKQLNNMVTETEFPSIVHKSPPPQGISQPSVSLESNQPQTLTHVSENGIVKQPETKVDLHESSPKVQLASEDHFTQVSRAASPIEESRLLEQSIAAHHPRGSHHARSRHAGDSHEDIYEQSAFSGEQYEQSHDTHSSSGYAVYNPLEERVKTKGVLPSSNDVEGTSSSVMSTITSALRDVEPGPVLGVSGGMGVLFLLFKYTPVGSFFGGRRRRFRQIPSRFRGYPPGEFPNFQEYESGYIGYGPMNINPLAE